MPTVLITGINGFLAVHAAVQFLERGWNVRGTVRSEAKAKAVKALGAFKNYVGKVEVIVVEDLAKDDLGTALKGVDAIAHVAAPFQLNLKTWKDYRDGAVEATKHVLSEAAKYDSIKSFVLLSSFVTVDESDKPYAQFKGKVFTEKDWYPMTEGQAASLNVEDEGTNVVWYCASKKFQELAAMDYVKEHKPSYTLSVLCPSYVLGPSLEIDTVEDFNNAPGLVTGFLKAIFLGKGEEPPFDYFPSWVDVRDVGVALVEAATRRAEGRYIIAAGLCDSMTMLRAANKTHPELKHLFAKEGPSPLERDGSFTVDNSKSIKGLGIKYRSLEEMVSGTLERYKALGAA